MSVFTGAYRLDVEAERAEYYQNTCRYIVFSETCKTVAAVEKSTVKTRV